MDFRVDSVSSSNFEALPFKKQLGVLFHSWESSFSAGDMAPVTWPGKILAGVLCLISVLFMAMPLSVPWQPWIGTGCGIGGCKPGMAKLWQTGDHIRMWMLV